MFERLHCLNFGISKDQTQHVLWRLENGELENMLPKVRIHHSQFQRILTISGGSSQASLLGSAPVTKSSLYSYHSLWPKHGGDSRDSTDNSSSMLVYI
jgi:hypothetical protein